MLRATDVARDDVLADYIDETRASVRGASTPAEAWEQTASDLDWWTPVLLAIQSVYDSDGSRASYCTARLVLAWYGYTMPDIECTIQRPCWLSPETP